MPRGDHEPYKIFNGLRDCFLLAATLFGVLLVGATEVLSCLGLIRRGPLVGFWVVVLAAACWWVCFRMKMPRLPGISRDPVILVCLAGVAAVLAITGMVAVISPPNSTDAMAYHLPRVVYWAEQGSVRFFPTQYLNQIMLQPMAEYAMLHTYVIWGGDRWINFGQWLASAGAAIGVSSVAKMMGAGGRGQALAALFCVTLPSGILASSGAKNDYILALWMVASVYFALRFGASERYTDALLLGACIGLALLTKATGYLFLPWFVLAAVWARGKIWWRGAGFALACALLLNAPQYIRNWELSGSPMGSESAQGDGVYRWRNESLGWKPTVSNLLRNLSEQLGARSEHWNNGVFRTVVALHKQLGIEVNDAGTTWRTTAFQAPRNSNHEADAPNRWHLAILLAVSFWIVIRRRNSELLAYVAALALALVSFCAYLKWQPFFARLMLPLFVMGSPLVGVGAVGGARVFIQIALCLFLLNNARPALFENWVRPLKGADSIFRRARDAQYFADMKQWENEASYRSAAALIGNSNCGVIGLDTTNLHIEYPLQALIREGKPDALFLHMGVDNASMRFAPPVVQKPCAVVCLDCAGDEPRLARYGSFQKAAQAGKFVVFTKSRGEVE